MIEQQKTASEMTPAERDAFLTDLKRGAQPAPMPTDKKASEMTKAEAAEWLAEHKRRWQQ